MLRASADGEGGESLLGGKGERKEWHPPLRGDILGVTPASRQSSAPVHIWACFLLQSNRTILVAAQGWVRLESEYENQVPSAGAWCAALTWAGLQSRCPWGSRDAQGERREGKGCILLVPSFLITGVTYTHITHTLEFLSPAEPGFKQDNEEA